MATSNINFFKPCAYCYLSFPPSKLFSLHILRSGSADQLSKNLGNPRARCYLFSSSPVCFAGPSTLPSWPTQKLQKFRKPCTHCISKIKNSRIPATLPSILPLPHIAHSPSPSVLSTQKLKI